MYRKCGKFDHEKKRDRENGTHCHPTIFKWFNVAKWKQAIVCVRWWDECESIVVDEVLWCGHRTTEDILERKKKTHSTHRKRERTRVKRFYLILMMFVRFVHKSIKYTSHTHRTHKHSHSHLHFEFAVCKWITSIKLLLNQLRRHSLGIESLLFCWCFFFSVCQLRLKRTWNDANRSEYSIQQVIHTINFIYQSVGWFDVQFFEIDWVNWKTIGKTTNQTNWSIELHLWYRTLFIKQYHISHQRNAQTPISNGLKWIIKKRRLVSFMDACVCLCTLIVMFKSFQ